MEFEEKESMESPPTLDPLRNKIYVECGNLMEEIAYVACRSFSTRKI